VNGFYWPEGGHGVMAPKWKKKRKKIGGSRGRLLTCHRYAWRIGKIGMAEGEGGQKRAQPRKGPLDLG